MQNKRRPQNTRQRQKSRQSKTTDAKKKGKETDFKTTRLAKDKGQAKQQWETNKKRENKGNQQEIIEGSTSNVTVPPGPVECEAPEKNGVSDLQR